MVVRDLCCREMTLSSMGATGEVYKAITVSQLCAALALYDAGSLNVRSLRVFFATFELKAIREAAARSRKRKDEKGRGPVPLYRLKELERFTGLGEGVLRRECTRLEACGLVAITEMSIDHSRFAPEIAVPMIEVVRGNRSALRPVPVPRRILRYLSRCTQIALIKTIVAYVIRGLTLDRKTGEIRNCGTVKASWIADSFWLSLRSVKNARRKLIELGWLSQDSTISQRKLNRSGAYFQIDLAWKPSEGTQGQDRKDADTTKLPVDNTGSVRREIAPPHVRTGHEFAPPKRNLRTSNESRNQKTQGSKPIGVCIANTIPPNKDPALSDVTFADLNDFHRTRSLYEQAIRRKWLEDSEANFLNWVSAAVRAKTSDVRDPVRTFIGIVRRGLWTHITQADEDRARAAIRRFGEEQSGLPTEIESVLRMVA